MNKICSSTGLSIPLRKARHIGVLPDDGAAAILRVAVVRRQPEQRRHQAHDPQLVDMLRHDLLQTSHDFTEPACQHVA